MLKANFNRVFSWLGQSTFLILIAIVIGSTTGITSPIISNKAGDLTDPIILILVTLLLIEVPVKGFMQGLSNIKFITISWLTNFILIPSIGFLIASLFLSEQAIFFTGLVIYFMAPCTDWYLGFTKMAKGNIELGATLLPINMASQVLLFPVYLLAFDTTINYDVNLLILLDWFIQPLVAAIIIRLVLKRFMQQLLFVCRIITPFVLAVLVGLIFASHINTLIGHIKIVPTLLIAIFIFFMITYVLSELISRFAQFDYPECCLLSFTTGARNAPLMLGLTTIAIPDQPLIYATITIGMLIEFPHLMTLKMLFLRRLQAANTKPQLNYS